ncbi:VOC family protein [Pseudoroseicyclus sp. CXY001]|uniref:VOC family protein n=1 Tax=Pseudoroseicyclus sp. CXY001 TaxID=3242492 RepID=UPI003570D485
MSRIGLVTLVVPDYDAAIAHYTGDLGFELIEDQPQEGKRWVVVRPKGGETGLLLAKAKGPAQEAAIGAQTGGRVFLFLETEDFVGDHARMQAAGVAFMEEPRDEPYGRVAVFRDAFGNLWDLLERR